MVSLGLDLLNVEDLGFSQFEAVKELSQKAANSPSMRTIQLSPNIQ